MRVAYVAEWDFSQVSGVSQKILSQLKCWRELGVEAEGFFVTPELPLAENCQPTTHFFAYPFPKGFGGSVKTYLNKIASASKVSKALLSFRPDVIYYRQNIGYPGQIKFLKTGKKLVIELNSLDLHEIELDSWFKKKLYLSQRDQILLSADAFCPVSKEIALSVQHLKKPTFVCGNGIDFKNYENSHRKIFSDRPQAIFVGSCRQPWHGIDRLNSIATQIPEVDFHIVGPEKEELSEIAPNINFYGTMTGTKLLDLYSFMDVGVGSLALSRKKMTEASPLKVREYGALGIPFIYAYEDTDLRDLNSPTLRISDHSEYSSEEVEAIRSFLFTHKHKAREPEAFKTIFDRTEKERQRLIFFEKVLSE